MKRTATMPVRTRRVTPAAVREWLHRENRICSLLLGERVENIILVAVALICFGIVLAASVTISIPMGLTGTALIATGASIIRKEDRV